MTHNNLVNDILNTVSRYDGFGNFSGTGSVYETEIPDRGIHRPWGQ